MASTQKQKIGQLGEDIACRYLKKKGFLVVSRNFRRKWGEIDVIAQKGNITHFFEVKTISRENISNVTRENDEYSPEDNIHPAKIKRMLRAVQTYIAGESEDDESEWQCDAIGIMLDLQNRKAAIRITEHIA